MNQALPLTVTYGWIYNMLSETEKKSVESGRVLIDEYRKEHAKLKDSERGVVFGKLLNSLIALKLGDEKEWPFSTIFDKSEQLNVETLGYKDVKDFQSNAKAEDVASIKSMWE
jgi:hypothetical protein